MINTVSNISRKVHLRASLYGSSSLKIGGGGASSSYSARIRASTRRVFSCLRSHQLPTTTTKTYTAYNAMRMPASQAKIRPSHNMISSKLTAMVKNPTSRRKGLRCTLNGLIIHIEPTTQDTMKDAAPSSSPIAKLPELARMAENVENTSGLPFPNARKVTPATFSSKPKSWAIVARLGVKKSEALMPRVENRKMSHSRRPTKTAGRQVVAVQ